MSGLSADILANEAKYAKAKYWEGPNGPTAEETRLRNEWMTSSGHAAAWFEGQKSDLSNPFQSRTQLELLNRNHDAVEAQIRQTTGENKANFQKQHDFYAECIGLIMGWKDKQDQTAAKKPAPEEAKAAAEQWAISMFKGFVPVTEGKSSAQLMQEVSNGRVLLPTAIGTHWQSAMSDAAEGLKSAEARKSNDPATSWDIEYWTTYQREVRKFKDFVDTQQARSLADKVTKSDTVEQREVNEINEKADDRKHNDTSDPDYHVDTGNGDVFPNREGGLPNGKVIDNKSESTYLWIGIGVAAAGVLAMAVFM